VAKRTTKKKDTKKKTVQKRNPVGKPRIFKTPKQLQTRIDDYIAKSRRDETPLTITGLCLHIGLCSRSSFDDYQELTEYAYTVKRAKLFVENGYETNLHNHNSTGSIFALKSMGWRDSPEQETSNDELAQALAKVLDAVPN